MSASTGAKQAKQFAEKALHAIGVLFEPGDVIEIRALGVDQGPSRAQIICSGYFKYQATDAIAMAINSVAKEAEGIYVVLNRLNPVLLSRSPNRLQARPRHSTKDEDIIECRWLYIDLDPVRPAGISSSEEEHQAGLKRAVEIKDFLSTRGWPEPVFANSGNGAHLLYRIPAMAMDQARQLVKAILSALDSIFSDASVKVDESTANPSRLCKLYGTTARKGRIPKTGPTGWRQSLRSLRSSRRYR